MNIAALYNPVTITAQSWETLADVAERMRFHDVGAIPVFADGLLAGIITERDFVRAIAVHVDPEEAVVEDHMTPDPAIVAPQADAHEAAQAMLQMGIRHLPVVEDETLIGMLSSRDLLEDLEWESSFPASPKATA